MFKREREKLADINTYKNSKNIIRIEELTLAGKGVRMNNGQKNVRSSKNLTSKNRRNTKRKPIYKARDKIRYRSGAKPNNRVRDSSNNETRRRSPRKKDRYTQSDEKEFQLHKAVCAACNKDTEVPFKPTGVKPVYCRKCYEIQNSKKDSIAKKPWLSSRR